MLIFEHKHKEHKSKKFKIWKERYKQKHTHWEKEREGRGFEKKEEKERYKYAPRERKKERITDLETMKKKKDAKGPFGYRLLLKTENWKHCNKIIFKCVNSAMGPSFNENFVELDNL